MKKSSQFYSPEGFFKREIGVDSFLIDSCFSSTEGLNFEESPDLTFDDTKKVDEINFIIINFKAFIVSSIKKIHLSFISVPTKISFIMEC